MPASQGERGSSALIGRLTREAVGVTAEQSLVGAMGCASWRSHDRLREHADLAPFGGTIRSNSGVFRGATSALGLNEVGVTDVVMATMWRFGPRAAAYAVSSTAESNHLGADIAIVHLSSARVLLYQAKLAQLQGVDYVLKSSVTASQVRLLNRRRVRLDGIRYQVTGRVAIYQADHTPFLHRCINEVPFWDLQRWDLWWPRPHLRHIQRNQPSPVVGSLYYDEVLVRCGCSPSGVLASPAPTGPVGTVPVAMTWPWEFDTYEWLGGSSPLDGLDRRAARQGDLDERLPDFRPYEPEVQEISSEVASDFATQLARQLRLPTSQLLHLMVIP